MAEDDVQLRIRALVQGARDVERLANQVASLSAQGRQDPVSRVNPALERTRRIAGAAYQELFSLQGALTGIGAVAVLRGIVRLNDQFTELRGQLNLVTESEQQRLEVERQLFELSQRTRSALPETVELYARIARSSEDLGASQAELLAVTEGINQAVQISGASASAAQAALVQLGQGLAAGTLRGEEFNSVIEQTPRLARAIADGLGIAYGDLRELATSGQLTSQRVFQALLSQLDTLDDEFANLPRTVSQAMTQLRNEVQFALRDADMGPLIDSIDDLREQLTDPATLEGIQTFAAAIVRAFGGALTAINAVVDATEAAAEGFARFQVGPDTAIGQVEEKIASLREAIASTEETIGDLDGGFFGTLIGDAADRRVEELRGSLVELRAELERQVALREDLIRMANKPKSTAPETQPDPADPLNLAVGGSDGAGAGTDRQKQIRAIIQALQEQADTYGQTATEIALYRLEALGATEQQLDEARAIAASVAARRRQHEAVERSNELFDEYQEQLRQNREADQALQRSLEEQIRLVGLSARERAQEQAVLRLSTDATDAQREAVRRLAGELYDLQAATASGTDQLNEFAREAARNIQNIFADLLFSPFEQGLDGMVRSFVTAMQRIAAEAAAAAITKRLFGASFGETGQLGGLVGTFVSSVFHAGGVAGESAPARAVPASAYLGAPRYHTGGIAGDEVPAILRRGEEVLTADDPRHRNNFGGLAAQTSVKIINAIDSGSVVSEGMSTPDGTRAIMNVLRANKSAVKQVLA